MSTFRTYMPESGTGSRGSYLARLLKSGISGSGVLALSLVYFLAMWLITPGLGSSQNLRNIFSNIPPLLVVSIGQTIVLISGGIDLSATSIIGLTSVIGAFVMTSDSGLLGGSQWATAAGIAVMSLGGAVVGSINGLAIARLKMPAFIVTLTSMMFLSGLSIWLTKSRPIYNLPNSFCALGQRAIFGVPNALIIAVATALAAHLFLSRTLWGRWIFAVGMNARAAAVSGVPVSRVTILAYVLSGFCAAVSSVLFTSRLETGSPVLGQRILLDVIGAAVIGGTSLFGGQGKVVWTVVGVWFLCLIDNSLNMLGLSFFMVIMVKGAVILFASLMDVLRQRLALRA